MSEITAHLKNAILTSNNRLCGEIYGDSRKRFSDGSSVITSPIVRREDGNVFVTLNSTYAVDNFDGCAA